MPPNGSPSLCGAEVAYTIAKQLSRRVWPMWLCRVLTSLTAFYSWLVDLPTKATNGIPINCLGTPSSRTQGAKVLLRGMALPGVAPLICGAPTSARVVTLTRGGASTSANLHRATFSVVDCHDGYFFYATLSHGGHSFYVPDPRAGTYFTTLIPGRALT